MQCSENIVQNIFNNTYISLGETINLACTPIAKQKHWGIPSDGKHYHSKNIGTNNNNHDVYVHVPQIFKDAEDKSLILLKGIKLNERSSEDLNTNLTNVQSPRSYALKTALKYNLGVPSHRPETSITHLRGLGQRAILEIAV